MCIRAVMSTMIPRKTSSYPKRGVALHPFQVIAADVTRPVRLLRYLTPKPIEVDVNRWKDHSLRMCVGPSIRIWHGSLLHMLRLRDIYRRWPVADDGHALLAHPTTIVTLEQPEMTEARGQPRTSTVRTRRRRRGRPRGRSPAETARSFPPEEFEARRILPGAPPSSTDLCRSGPTNGPRNHRQAPFPSHLMRSALVRARRPRQGSLPRDPPPALTMSGTCRRSQAMSDAIQRKARAQCLQQLHAAPRQTTRDDPSRRGTRRQSTRSLAPPSPCRPLIAR